MFSRDNTVIRLSAADASFGGSVYPTNGATYTEPTTVDGGKTWVIKRITLPVAQPK